MITGDMKTKVDKLWTEFWTGGIANPLTVIEQISFLMFSRMLDLRELTNERKARRLGSKAKVKMIFTDHPNPKKDPQRMRWSNFKDKSGQEMLEIVRDEVFPHFKMLGGKGSTLSEYMADAQFLIQKPSLLVSAVQMIDKLPIDSPDSKGDLYEYLLNKLTNAGINGQFRTPRHIIKMMVELVAPQPTDSICDPACGTGGFLAAALDYIYRTNTSEEGIIRKENEEGDIAELYSGDNLSPTQKEHIHNGMIHGFDFDVTMLRLASMNLILHGLDKPNIHYCDTLSNAMAERFPKYAENAFDVVLANPPFKGSLDYEDVHSSLLGKVKTKKTELLFLVLMLRMLKLGGRCAVVVPDGVLFGSSTAHTGLRKMLVENNQLEAVISLPPGVFRPYASVSTAVLVFAKGDPDVSAQTENVFFYDVQADGLSLDDKRTPVEENDLPDVVQQWKKWEHGKKRALKNFENRKSKAFFVPRQEIANSEYDLSITHYKEHVYKAAKYDQPVEIITRLKSLECEIGKSLRELGEMIK